MTATDLIINIMKASTKELKAMDIAKVAKKYRQKPEDVRFLRDHELRSRG